MKDCCNHKVKDKACIRKSDKKTFNLRRKFSRKKCRKAKGFSIKASCGPYKDFFSKTRSCFSLLSFKFSIISK